MTHRILPPAAVADLAAYERGDDRSAHGPGGRGLRRARELGPDGTLAEVERARLRGRGGAGFPAAVKWRQVRSAARRRGELSFVVANGAEGEPGSYKDRLLLERTPYAALEGTLVAAHAAGAERAIVAVRERDAHVVRRVLRALDEVRTASWPGADHLEVATGPDDYLFGQETGLLEVLEGRPPRPRVLRPDQAGLHAGPRTANPTLVANVETLVHAAAILADGADRFLASGTAATPGTILCTVTGDVARAGVWELPAGTPLRTLLVDRAGARDVLAVLAGLSGGVITRDQFDTPLEFDAMRTAGLELGSGAFVAADRSRCVVQVLARLARFGAREACGQCVACGVGTAEIADRLHRIDTGAGTQADLDRIRARTRWLTDGTRCALPRGVERTVASTLAAFGDAVEAHLGAACPSTRPIATPLIDALDPATGEVTLHPAYDEPPRR